MNNMRTFESFFGSEKPDLEIGGEYIFMNDTVHPQIKKKVKYIGTYGDNPDMRVHSTFKDFKPPNHIFQWLEGDAALSSEGRKGHNVGLSDYFVKNI